jgi:hypothetical protein
MKDGAAHATGQASLVDASGPSSAPPRGYGGGSARSKVVWILSDAPGLVCLACGSRSWIDNTRLLPVWIEASEK